MHSLFNLQGVVQYGVMKFGEWPWVRDGLKRNIGTVISYYRANPRAVRGNHFLVHLLGSISVPKSQNLERYYDNVDALALNVAMALKMTSSVYPGKVFQGVFYGPGTHEVLVAHTSSFDFQEAHRDWKNVAAVKVLRTPRSDLGYNLPNGEASGSETGLAVIAINIPLLAIQYRAFRLEQDEVQGSPRSLEQFVHMYVLPNMLWSQTDQVLFNRLNRLSQNQPLGQSSERHPFPLPVVYEEHTDKVLVKALENFRAANRSFGGMLQTIPAVSEEHMEQVMRLPAMAQTRQVVWALTVARLPMLSLLFRESRDGARARNQHEVNAIARSILAFKNGNVMRTYLPPELFHEVQNEIEEILVLPEVTIA